MRMSVEVDITTASAKMRAAPKQVRFGVAVGLTRTGREVKQAQQEEIRRVFDRPTRFTQNAPYLASARADRLMAEVFLKGGSRADAAAAAQAGQTTSRGHYLEPQVFGGGRRHKRFEELLMGQSVLPQGWYAIPGRGARYDSYGNMRPAQMVEILSAFRAFVLAGSSQNRTDGSRKRNKKLRNYFVSHPNTPKKAANGGRLPYGVYELLRNGQIKTVLRFRPRVSYRQRYDFDRVGREVADRSLVPNIEGGIRFALASAR